MRSGWAWVCRTRRLTNSRLAGWLFFRPFLSSDIKAFTKHVSDYSETFFNITVRPDSVDLAYSVALHDAIMLYAHAATTVLSKGGDLRDGEAVTATMHNTTFMGVAGTLVVLDTSGDRIESYGDELRSWTKRCDECRGCWSVQQHCPVLHGI